MSEIKLYVNTHTNIYEGRHCYVYFRKNDIIITDSDYGCQISIKSEEYTSKCCGNCGFLLVKTAF